MKTSREKDSSKALDIFEGSITRVTLKMSIPVLISQFLVLAHTFVDTFFVSLINKESTALLSGTGLIFPIYFIYLSLCRGMYVGASSIVARGIGQKNEEVIERTGDSGLLLSMVIGFITLILGLLFGRNLIQMIAGRELTTETIKYANEYFYFLLPGMILLLAQNTLSGILQGEGLTKYIAFGTILSTVSNLILTPTLIFLFKFGVKGSSLATSISIGLNVFYYLVLFLKKKTTIPIQWSIFKVNKDIIKEILRIGIPLSLGMFLANISIIILNNLVGSISEEAMNAWVLVNRTDQLFLVPGYAIGTSTLSMVGQNYGRGNLKRVQRIFLINTIMCILVSSFLAIFYIVFSSQLFRIFSSVPEVINGSVRQVRFLGITIVINTCIFVIISFFQAIGKPKPVLINQIIRAVIFASPITLLFLNFTIKDMTPIYICFGAGNVLSPLIGFIWANSYLKRMQVNEQSVPA